ncbi:MAG: hypothetical protein EAZ62_05775, partial [Sphingobacteriia bacterium]
MQNIEIQYFGSVYWYKILFKKTNVNLNSFVLHQKSSKWNTTLLPSANGVVRLSVPLVGGRSVRQSLADLKIAYRDNWVAQHTR